MTNSNLLKQAFILVIACASLLALPWLERPFHTRGEPREALVAQSMLKTGNWISPPAYDGAVPSKPPFSHWLIAIASLPGGEVTEATSRLPSAVAIIVFSAAFFAFLSKRLSQNVALATSLILLSSSEWFRAASTCRVDTILATSMAGAMLALYAWWERDFKGIPWLALVLTSFAALTKGPVGIVLPVGLFSLFCWIQGGLSARILLPIALRGLYVTVPVALVGSVWYILGYLDRGEAFIDKIRYENFERFTSQMADEPHKHSAVYMVGMLFLGLLPWSIPLILATLAAFMRGDLSLKGVLQRSLSKWRSLSPLYQYSWIVSLGVFVFFCIPSSKRSVYLLPMYPCAALLIEGALRRIATHAVKFFTIPAKIITAVAAFILVCAVVLNITKVLGVSLDPSALLESMRVTKLLSVLLILALILWLANQVSREAFHRPVEKLAGAVLLAVVAISFFIYDSVAWQLSPKKWLNDPALVKALNSEPNPRLLSFGSEAYGASFYLERPFSRAAPGGDIPTGSLVFMEARKLQDFQQQLGLRSEEVTRYSSGLESSKKDVVVVRVVGE